MPITHHKIIKSAYRAIREITGIKAQLKSDFQSDLGMDSLDILELKIYIEHNLNVDLGEYEISHSYLRTVEDFVDCVLKDIREVKKEQNQI